MDVAQEFVFDPTYTFFNPHPGDTEAFSLMAGAIERIADLLDGRNLSLVEAAALINFYVDGDITHVESQGYLALTVPKGWSSDEDAPAKSFPIIHYR